MLKVLSRFFQNLKFRRQLKKRGITKEDKKAIWDFVQNLHWGQDLTDAEAKHNLEMGLVELSYRSNQHIGNGLLITQNGLFISCWHCADFKNFSEKIRVALNDGRIFPIRCIYSRNIENDFVVARAEIPGPAAGMRYRFTDFELTVRKPVVLLTRWNGATKLAGGFTTGRFLRKDRLKSGGYLRNAVILDMSSRPGNSGGVVIYPDSSIVGILAAGDNSSASAIEWKSVLKFLSSFYSKI